MKKIMLLLAAFLGCMGMMAQDDNSVEITFSDGTLAVDKVHVTPVINVSSSIFTIPSFTCDVKNLNGYSIKDPKYFKDGTNNRLRLDQLVKTVGQSSTEKKTQAKSVEYKFEVKPSTPFSFNEVALTLSSLDDQGTPKTPKKGNVNKLTIKVNVQSGSDSYVFSYGECDIERNSNKEGLFVKFSNIDDFVILNPDLATSVSLSIVASKNNHGMYLGLHKIILRENPVQTFVSNQRAIQNMVGGYHKTDLDYVVKNCKTIAEADTYLKNKKIVFANDEYYKLIPVSQSDCSISLNPNGALALVNLLDSDINQLWKFDSDNKIFNANRALFLSENLQLEEQTKAAVITATEVQDNQAQYNVQCGSKYLTASEKILGSIDNLTSSTTERWYFMPVQQIEISLSPIGEPDAGGEQNYVSTIYLPFDAQCFLEKELEYYVASKSQNNGNEITLKQIDGVYANQGVILKSHGKTENLHLKVGKYIERPLTGMLKDYQNVLSGSNIPLPVTDANSIYVMGNGTLGLGFYHPSETLITLAANKAFIKKESVPAGVNGFSIDFGDLTGIEEVEAQQHEAAEQVIYDLSGRRVNHMTKGIYIVNGKKVMVK